MCYEKFTGSYSHKNKEQTQQDKQNEIKEQLAQKLRNDILQNKLKSLQSPDKKYRPSYKHYEHTSASPIIDGKSANLHSKKQQSLQMNCSPYTNGTP